MLGLETLEAERIEVAAPIYPDDDEIAPEEARDLARQFRILRDDHLGEVVAPRSLLPGEPGRVAAALISDGDARMENLAGDDLKAAQRELAEALVDLQSFRRDDEAALILAGPSDAEGIEAAEALKTARAAIIAWIREDPSVLGNLNAIRDIELRIGDARQALDTVKGHRDKQALGFRAVFLATFGGGALAVIAIVVVVAFIVLRVLT